MDSEQFPYKTVMLIDDTEIDRYVAAAVIRKNQFTQQLLQFDMATKAIAYLEENAAHPELLPQVILLDINMPQMDGFQFLEKLDALPEDIRNTCCIVMLTSSLNPADHERAASIPSVKKFVNKPLNKDSLSGITQVCGCGDE